MNRIRINTLLLLLCIFLPGVAQDVSDGWNKNKTARLTKPVFVYNNWSAYDELSDNIPLNETLAMKELDHIAFEKNGCTSGLLSDGRILV